MKRLILTTSDSGAGGLKSLRVANWVVGFIHRLVYRPPPTPAETESLFSVEYVAALIGRDWVNLIDACMAFDSIELWIDPDPNAQLMLLQLLDFLGPHQGLVEKMILVHSAVPLSEQEPSTIDKSQIPSERVNARHLETAILAWNAFWKATPEAWFALLAHDLSSLPYLRQIVIELLDELPGATTALGATEMKMLSLISQGPVVPFDVFPGFERKNSLRVYDFWEAGPLLDQLAHTLVPAVQGLEYGPFDMRLIDDRPRYQRYKDSNLSLTEFGEALVESRDDFSRHNRIHRWWGGTLLENDRLWRWDALNKVLMAPF